VLTVESIADQFKGATLGLAVLVGVDLLSQGQARVSEDELGIASRDTEILEQGRSRVPQVMDLDRSRAAGGADAVERANKVARQVQSLPITRRAATHRPGR
jgi:hypothetical protein